MKPGDLAVVINSECNNNGIVVRCKKRVASVTWRSPDGNLNVEKGWEFWPALVGFDGLECHSAPDSQLLPLLGLSIVSGVK